MSIIWNILIVLSLGVFLLTMIVGNFLRIWYAIKCRKIKTCENKQCMVREYCHKYREVFTEEDIERIKKLIDQL